MRLSGAVERNGGGGGRMGELGGGQVRGVAGGVEEGS